MQLVTINWHVYLLMRPYGEKQAAAALGLVGLVRELLRYRFAERD